MYSAEVKTDPRPSHATLIVYPFDQGKKQRSIPLQPEPLPLWGLERSRAALD